MADLPKMDPNSDESRTITDDKWNDVIVQANINKENESGDDNTRTYKAFMIAVHQIGIKRRALRWQ